MDYFLRKNRYCVPLFLVLVTAAVFWQVTGHDFVSFDDDEYVYDNAHVRRGLTADNVVWAFTTTHAHNWHPLTWISHMADVGLFGLDARRHHLVSLLFHLANAVLLFLVLKRMTGALWRSAFVGALFALHPLHVESVAWISERKDLLSTLFFFLTLAAYTSYVEKGGKGRYLLVFALFVLGLMAKPMLVTLPFVLLLLDYWPYGRFAAAGGQGPREATASAPPGERGKKIGKGKAKKTPVREAPPRAETRPVMRPASLVAEKIPLFAVVVVASGVTLWAQQRVVKPMELFPLPGRIANAFLSYAMYLVKTFWPVDLAVFYPYVRLSLLSPPVILSVLFLGAVTAFAFLKARRHPYLVVGWLWYLGTLVPVIGLVQVGLQAMADRYTYTTLIGVFIMIAWGVPDLLKGVPRRREILAVLAALALAVSAAVTWHQVRFWQNSLTLYERAAKVTKGNWWAHYNLGLTLMLEGKDDEALKNFQEALRYRPDDPEALLNVGVIHARRGDVEGAAARFRRVLEVNPSSDKAHRNLGKLFLDRGDAAGALGHLKEAVRLDPSSAENHFFLGRAYARGNDLEKAAAHYLEALRLKPDHVEAINNLGIVLARQGKIDEAIARFREALFINHSYREAQVNLQAALRLRDGGNRGTR